MAGYMFRRARSMPQTSTHRSFPGEPVHAENYAILLLNEWSVRCVCNALHLLHVDNRQPQQESCSYESLSEMKLHFDLPMLSSFSLLRATRIFHGRSLPALVRL